MGGKRQWVTGIVLREAYHFAHFDDDLGERKAALLVRRYLRPYRGTKRIDECKEPFVVAGDEIIGRPYNWGFFHERPGGGKGVASSAGMLPHDRGRSEMRAGGDFPQMIIW